MWDFYFTIPTIEYNNISDKRSFYKTPWINNCHPIIKNKQTTITIF